MWQKFSPAARQAILLAQEFAVARGHATVEPAHLLLGLLAVTEEYPSRIPEILILAGVAREEVRLYCEAILPPGNATEPEPPLTPAGKQAIELTANVILLLNPPTIEPEHLLLALALQHQEPHYEAVLKPLGLSEEQLLEHLEALNTPGMPIRHPLKLAGPESRVVLERADRIMRDTFCGRIGTAHLLLALLEDNSDSMTALLQAAEIDVAALRAAVRRSIVQDGQIATAERRFDRAAQRALDQARDLAFSEKRLLWQPRHLLLALLPRPLTLKEKLRFETKFIDSASSLLEPYASQLKQAPQTEADGDEEIPENLRPSGAAAWLVPLGLFIAAPLTAWLGYELANNSYGDSFEFFGIVILFTHTVLILLFSYTVATTRDTRSRLQGISYLLGLALLAMLTWVWSIF